LDKYDKLRQDKEGNDILSKYFKKFRYKNPVSGFECVVDVGYEAFLGPEMLFHPEFVDKKAYEKIKEKKAIDEIINDLI